MAEEAESQRDVTTEPERLKQQLDDCRAHISALEKELNEFAYVVSHDLRAPLRAVSQLAGWIAEDQREALDDDGKEMIDLMLGRLERMDGLLEGILQFSRIGRIREALADIDTLALVEQIVREANVPDNIDVMVGRNLPIIRGERGRIEQIFKHLIDNALKFMDKPEGKVLVDGEDAGDHWRFRVSDNGPGIDPAYHEKVFQLFQTLAPRDEFESSGMGLTLVKKIVEVSGGKVDLESEMGKGSAFIITLPKDGAP